MKKLIPLLISIILTISFSCGNRERETQIEVIEDDNFSQKQVDSILTKYKLEYDNPIYIKGTSQILIPISIQYFKKRKRYYNESSYGYEEYSTYWNILFYDSETDETNLFTEKKYRITDIDIDDENEKRSKKLKNKIFYRIAHKDYNKDKKLNSKDPKSLFVSEINGTQIKRISPANENLLSYDVIPNTNQILIKTTRDSNRNLKFEAQDEELWYKATLVGNKWKLIKLINPSLREKMKNLYFKQWLIKKKKKQSGTNN